MRRPQSPDPEVSLRLHSPHPPRVKFYLSATEVSVVHQLDGATSTSEASQILRSLAARLSVFGRAPTQCGIKYCAICGCVKPDRSHHCSTCNQCVRKMDHHCIWLNNCVSFTNYKLFILTLTYGTLFNTMVWATSLEFFIKYFIKDTLGKQGLGSSAPNTTSPSNEACVSVVILFLLSLVLSLSSFSLLCFHVFLVSRNRTTLEQYRPPMFEDGCLRSNAYDIGLKRNIQEVFGTSFLKALNPFVDSAKGDGLHFSSKYTPSPNIDLSE